MHRPHKHEVDDFWNINAGVKHVDGNGETRLVLLLKLGDESVAIRAIVYPLDTVIDKLKESGVLREHFLECFADATGVVLGHCENDGLSGKSAAAIFDA